MAWISSRRRFLGGVGAGLIAAPFLRLLNGEARASTLGPTRLLVYFTPNGTIHEHLWPTGGSSSFSFPAGSILEPLAPHAQDLVILSGLNLYNADNHSGGMAAMLTNGGGASTATGNQSIDQVIAGHIAGETRFPSLELGVQTSAWGGSSQTRMCYAGPELFVTPDDSPGNVYQRMFGELLVGAEEAAKRRERRQKVVDIHRAQLQEPHM